MAGRPSSLLIGFGDPQAASAVHWRPGQHRASRELQRCPSAITPSASKPSASSLDASILLPSLATYLGHEGPAQVYWYLQAVPQLLELATERGCRPVPGDVP